MGFTWSLKNEEKNSTTEYQNIPPVKQWTRNLKV
jgi:hypothetical protein